MQPAPRVSDSDRDRTVATLGEHAAAGRLSLEEFDTRAQAAYAARTVDDLVAVTADLPDPQPASPAPRPVQLPSAVLYATIVAVFAVVVLAVLGVAASATVADGMNGMTGMMGGMSGGGCR